MEQKIKNKKPRWKGSKGLVTGRPFAFNHRLPHRHLRPQPPSFSSRLFYLPLLEKQQVSVYRVPPPP